jgi:hypothetical protein
LKNLKDMDEESEKMKRGVEEQTISDTIVLPPFRSSGAIQGSVPRTPPEIRVWHFTLERPRSATWREAQGKISLRFPRRFIPTMFYQTRTLILSDLEVPLKEKGSLHAKYFSAWLKE